MKAIELTGEQKMKLLEMCHALYPEHKFGFGEFWSTEVGAEYIGLDYLDVTHINHPIPAPEGGGHVSNIDDSRFFFSRYGDKIKAATGYSEKYVEGIHWFEFCMTHLAFKVLVEPCGYESIEDYINMNSYFIFGHPVDYLYEQFKQLTK